jgi:hypothetical protein
MAIVDENGIGIVFKLRLEIAGLEQKIKSIQMECSHPKEALIEKRGSNTGNYDPSSDCHWADYHCHLCDKKWREDR